MLHSAIGPRQKIKVTMCICPRCRKEHKIRMEWTGKGTPRIYCYICLETMDNTYTDQNFHTIRTSQYKSAKFREPILM